MVVNVGDLLDFWTGGAVRSVLHRVVLEPENGDADRYSMAYFCHPASGVELVRVLGLSACSVRGGTSTRDDEMEEEKDVITAGEHLRRKLDKAYRWGKPG